MINAASDLLIPYDAGSPIMRKTHLKLLVASTKHARRKYLES